MDLLEREDVLRRTKIKKYISSSNTYLKGALPAIYFQGRLDRKILLCLNAGLPTTPTKHQVR
jgi:hypothetical protein